MSDLSVRSAALVLSVLLNVAAPPEAADEVTLEQVRRCKTPDEVRQLMGSPARVARQIFYRGRVEQWVYDRPLACRVELLYRLGEEPRVQAVHPRGQGDR